jgi:hypothetical protein
MEGSMHNIDTFAICMGALVLAVLAYFVWDIAKDVRKLVKQDKQARVLKRRAAFYVVK